MHLLWINLLLLALTVGAPAQPVCDPTRQYEVEGECCEMCPPGTKMTTLGSCQKPECRECEEGRYTDTYTEQQECEKQPYCDPNKKFQWAVHKSKKERTECQCQLGFHCSSESCITCVPHKVCGPGEGAAIKGDHLRDTTCQRCPDGTFSNETSWNSDCKKWTECKSGEQIQKAGTHMSDIVCEPSRSHVVAWVILPVAVVILVCVFIWRYRKGKSGNLQICDESGWEEKPNKQKEGGMLLPQPVVQVEDESMSQDLLPSQEESRGTPEENDDESGLEIPSDIAFTDNGNYVAQEDGKKEVLSRQESQTQTFSEYKCDC